MRPIKIYLIVCSNKVDWIASVHRDLDDVLLAWEAVRRLPDTIGIVHVGISKPHTSRLGSIAASLSNCLLLTASARWVFDSIGTYSEAIDHVDCLGIHVALSGWGDANADAIDKALAHQAQQFNDKIVFTSPWLTDLERSDYELALEAWKRDVRDEESYHALEHSLTWQLRTSLGLARMHHLMRTRDYEDPIQVATSCPPWLLDTRIDEIGGTVRCVNALNYANIKVVGDLLELTTRDLLKIPNLGSKSVLDLASALTAAVQKGPNEINSSHSMGREGAEKNARLTFDLRTNEAPTVFLERHPSRQSFRHAFESVKSRLSDTQWFVLARRIGSGFEKMILQDIGEEMLITRERVRQIESKATEIFRADAVWTSDLLPKINNLLFDREDPLPAFGLGAFDPWFEGIEEAMPEFEYVLDRVLEGQLNLLDINGCRFVTQISKIDWLQSIRDGNGLLEVAAEIKMPKSQIKRQVEELLFNKGSELASELWASVQIPGIFTKDEEGVERVVGVGTGAEKLVSAVLDASDRPLHYTEIPKHVSDAFGRSIEIRRAHGAARNVGLLFGRGTFGTNRHLSLTPSESESLREEVEYIILSGARDRQWTCHELIQALGERVLDFQDRINQYVLQICLQNSTVLSDLGRFVWAQSGERPIGVQNRIDISQAILSLLQIYGRPMSREEIRNALQADRGLGNYFQIQPKGSLVRVGQGSWGILERDIPLDQVEIKSIQEAVAMLLTESGKGIHLSEIKHLLYPAVPEVQRISDPYAIFSVLSFDLRFKLSASGYIYFKEWESPRRLSQGDAIVEVLRRSGPQGLRTIDIAKQATELLGRPVERENVHSAIIANGAAYNEDSGRWILPEENPSLDSIDE